MYLWQVTELFDYWQQHPPLHVLAAGYLGYKPPRLSKTNDAASFAEFFAAMGGDVGAMG